MAHLRPAYFMENLLSNVRLIQMRGAVASPMRPDISMPMVATKDIAAKAAELLGTATFENHAAHYLLGPRNYSMQEATTILGKAIGQPELPYQQLSYDESRAGLLKAGMSEHGRPLRRHDSAPEQRYGRARRAPAGARHAHYPRRICPHRVRARFPKSE
ncbi:MAG: hypothetical protein WKG07_34845 [Hymenobacter sp.]